MGIEFVLQDENVLEIYRRIRCIYCNLLYCTFKNGNDGKFHVTTFFFNKKRK